MNLISELTAGSKESWNTDNALSGDCPFIENFISLYPVDSWESFGFLVRDEMKDWIPCHWMKFDPVDERVHLVLSFIYLALFAVGLTSNSIVIYIITSTSKLLTPSNILLINLAISDLLMVATVPTFIFNSIHQGPAIGKAGCTAYGFVGGLAGTSSIMTLTAIAVERFLVITNPLYMNKKPTRTWACVARLFIWLYSFAIAGLPLVGVGKYVPEGYLTGCSFDYISADKTNQIFVLSFIVAAWLFPLVVIVSCYALIVREVALVRQNVFGCINITKKSGIPLSSTSTINSFLSRKSSGGSVHCQPRRVSPAMNQNDLETTIVKSTFTLIASWLIAWTPYALVSLFGIAGYSSLITPISSTLPAMLAKFSSCVDPFIYALNHPTTRQEVSSRLLRLSSSCRCSASTPIIPETFQV